MMMVYTRRFATLAQNDDGTTAVCHLRYEQMQEKIALPRKYTIIVNYLKCIRYAYLG